MAGCVLPDSIKAQERRVVPETIARFIAECVADADFSLRPVQRLPHTFDAGRVPARLRNHERDPDWQHPELASRYPRLSTDRDTAEKHNLEWVTPGHPLFEALRRHSLAAGEDAFAQGACFHSLTHDAPARLDFYRARAADGLHDSFRDEFSLHAPAHLYASMRRNVRCRQFVGFGNSSNRRIPSASVSNSM